MEYEAKQLRQQITSICWYMRGGYSRDDAWTLSYAERNDVLHFISDKIRTVEKTGLPIL